MSVELEVLIRGSTVRVVATITEFDHTTLIDPDVGTQTATFYDSTGTSQGTGSIIKDSLGVYHSDFLIAKTSTSGNWHVDWYLEKGSEPAIGRAYFAVTT